MTLLFFKAGKEAGRIRSLPSRQQGNEPVASAAALNTCDYSLRLNFTGSLERTEHRQIDVSFSTFGKGIKLFVVFENGKQVFGEKILIQ
jgi:hypothetical protein